VHHAVAVVGARYVAVGTDGSIGGYANEVVWRDNVQAMTSKLDPDGSFGARWPDQCNDPAELTMPQRLAVLYDELIKVAPSHATVGGIMGLNAQQFLQGNLPRMA
jgi:microsomal dipeptidase-like Zn-dependent dipeptidase